VGSEDGSGAVVCACTTQETAKRKYARRMIH
jgi:hypothetical protein